jgi:hypothetical protein
VTPGYLTIHSVTTQFISSSIYFLILVIQRKQIKKKVLKFRLKFFVLFFFPRYSKVFLWRIHTLTAATLALAAKQDRKARAHHT